MNKLILTPVLIFTFFSHPLWSNSLAKLRFPLSVSLEGFDPTEAEDFINIRILLNLGRGLVVSDKNLKPQLALAKSYKISANRKKYTFNLKKSFWSDGTLIVAEDFVRGWEHTFSPTTKAKVAQNLIEIVEGAKDYKNKTLTDFSKVGVKAITPTSLEVTLTRPAGYFLSLLSLPFAFPQKVTGQLKVGSATSGPYIISELKRASKITLKPNEYFKPQAQNEVELKIITESATQLSLYEKKELDVLEKVPSSDFERFKNNPELVSSPFLATYYLGFNIDKKPYDNIAVRKTLFNAINRNDLAKIFTDPQIIASSWVPTPLPTSDKIFKITVSEDEKKQAEEILKNTNLELAMDAQDKNIVIGTLIQQQIKKVLNLDLKIKTMEWKSYINYLSQDHPGFFRFAWLTAFPDPLSHLNVFTSNNPNNYTGLKDKIYDDTVMEVATLNPSVLRTSKIMKAEKRLLEELAVILPLYHYKNYYLISSNWKGIEVTPMGILYFDKANLKHAP